MSVLKVYYDRTVNIRSIDITREVMNTIEEGRKPRTVNIFKKSKRRLVIALFALMLSILVGFTAIYDITFIDSTGENWSVHFYQPSKLDKAFDDIATNLKLDTGDIAMIYINDNNPNQQVHGYEYIFAEESIDVINKASQEQFNTTLSDTLLNMNFKDGSIGSTNFFVQSDIDISKILIDTTPKGAYSYLVYRFGKGSEFYCSDESVKFDPMPELLKKGVASVSYTYGNIDSNQQTADEYVNITINASLSQDTYKEGEYDSKVYETITADNRDILLERYEASEYLNTQLNLSTMENGIYITMELHSDTISEEEAIITFKELVNTIIKSNQ